MEQSIIIICVGTDHSSTGLKSKENLRKLYIGPAIEKGLVVMEMPDKPTSRNQTYVKKTNFFS